VVLTHAHIDHSGYLPVLARQGFRGPIWCTSATAALCGLLLPDAGYLQEEEAQYRNRTGTTRHQPALPLFTAEDGRAVLSQFRPVDAGSPFEAASGVQVQLSPAGHLLGAASARLDDGASSLLVSGDVGRPHDLLIRPPAPPPEADYLLVESTYGGRLHPQVDPEAEIEAIVNRTMERDGVVLVPAFAVGRAQLLMHLLAKLQDEGRIPTVPIFVDSPMATDATQIFREHPSEHVLTPSECQRMCATVHFVRSPEESKALDARGGRFIVISASGMATGGRVVHHLKAFVGEPRNTILLTGFQAAGTRGEALLHGVEQLKIHGRYWPVQAEVSYLRGVSGHADRDELLAWMAQMPRAPRQTWVVHGEPQAQDALRREISDRLGWRVAVPRFGQRVELGPRDA
jgi:metallo-beta-lactamase family protein